MVGLRSGPACSSDHCLSKPVGQRRTPAEIIARVCVSQSKSLIFRGFNLYVGQIRGIVGMENILINSTVLRKGWS